jgi:hypothetical protein
MSVQPVTPDPDARTVAAFVCGVLGIVALVTPLGILVLGPQSSCCAVVLVPCPVIAVVLGRRGPHPLARAAVILGWIAIGLYALAAALFLLLLLLGGAALVAAG